MKFGDFALGMISYFESSLWPLRLDPLIYLPDEVDFESKVELLAAYLEAQAVLRGRWMEVTRSLAGNEDEPQEGVRIRRTVRLMGPQQARAMILGLQLWDGRSEPRPALGAPLPFWKELGEALGSSERFFTMRLELATFLGVFLLWVVQARGATDLGKARRWLEERATLWATHLKGLEDEDTVRLFFLFELGRASMAVDHGSSDLWWKEGVEKGWPVPVRLHRETLGAGLNSAQLAALWATALQRTARLSTPLRLLQRPWRLQDLTVQIGQREAALRLLKKLEGGSLCA